MDLPSPSPAPHSASASSSSTATIGPISSIKPTTRSHSASISSVHFAQPLSRRQASTSGSAYPSPPTKSSTDPSNDKTERRVSPPTTPAPTPKGTASPSLEAQLHNSGRKANDGVALAHGKRASVVTGGYESSSSESESGIPRSSRRRAATLAFPVSTIPISRSSSDKSLQRETKRLTTISRHSSRDLLRSSVFRPVHPSVPNPPSRVSSSASSRSGLRAPRGDTASPGGAKPKRSQSPVRRELLRPLITSSPDSSRSRKGKERAEPRRDVLASSLGMGAGASGATLTADQINALLADSDVGAAIRIMGAPQTPSVPTPRPRTSPPTSLDDLHHPFLVSAPPALTQDIGFTRNRNISISTTASSPRQIRRLGSIDIPSGSSTAHRRRASSRAMPSMTDGGHVPFTHHIPPQLIVDSDDGAETEPTPSITVSTPRSPDVYTPDPKTGKRKRLSALFGLKHKTSDSSVQTVVAAMEPITSDKEKERQKREAEMRDKERQRRQDEIEEDRYYRALQQVSAHPHCVHLADHAKLHLWALYEHVYDGLENPPRFNPVAILRWKHKVEEQDLARKAWESRKTHLGASVESFSSLTKKKDPFARWGYTMDDVVRYKENEGHVEYFIPVREEVTAPLASVDELSALEHPESSNGSLKNESVKHEELTQARAVSNPSSTDLLRRSDSRGSFEPLSRSPSNDLPRHRKVSLEPGGYADQISHRAHQSLGHIGPFSIANHVVDKIGSMARRQRTLPPGAGDMSDSTMEESPLRAHPLRQSTSPVDRLHPEPNVHRSRTDRLLRRTYDNGRGATTDEEGGNGRRRVFPRSDRNKPKVADTSGSNDDRLETRAISILEPIEQVAELSTEEDKEVRKREMEAETALYVERARKLKAARAGLDILNTSLAIVDDNIKHYTVQLDQTQRSVKLATGYQISIGDSQSPKAPSRSDTVDRYIRDRLQATEHRMSDVRNSMHELDQTRSEAAEKLRGMVASINRLQAKTGEVDQWARRNMSEIEDLKHSRDRFLWRRDKPSFWQRREHDYWINASSRCVGWLVQAIYWIARHIFMVFGWRGRDSDGLKTSRMTQAKTIVPIWFIAGVGWYLWLQGGSADGQ